MSKITNIHIENFKRISAADVAPGTHLFVVGGDNEQGKSTLLDAIASAFGGAKSAPAQAIRAGAETGEVVVELSDGYRLRQRIRLDSDGRQSVTTQLTLTDESGVRSEIKSPQAMLSAMAGTLAFDPLSFGRMSAAEQLAALKKLVQLDTSALDAEHDAAFARRTDVERSAKQCAAQLEAMPMDATAPTEALDTAALAADLAAEQAKSDGRARLVRASEQTQAAHERAEQAAKNAEAALRSAEAALRAADLVIQAAQSRVVDSMAAAIAAAAEAGAASPGDVAGATARLAGVSEHNARHAKATARAALVAKLDGMREEYRALTETVKSSRSAKTNMIAFAKYPVDGLTLGDAGVQYNGVPFAQASQAVKVRVGLAIAAGMNPRLRCVLVREGAFLDEQSMATVAQWAIDNDMQVLMERVGHGAECAIIMHDGRVSEVRT